MRQTVLALVLVLSLAPIAFVRGQASLGSAVHNWSSTTGTLRITRGVSHENAETMFPEIESTAPLSVRMTPLLLARGTAGAGDSTIPGPLLYPAVATWAADPSLQQPPTVQVPAQGNTVGAHPALIATQLDGADRAPSHVRIAGVLTYKFTAATVPAVAGGANYTGPDVTTPTVHEVSVELGVTWTATPDASLFADLNTDYTSDAGITLIKVERLHFTLQNALSVQGLKLRIGRDGIRLGADGLLLDEVLHDDDRRDGFQIWTPAIGAINATVFLQYALDDRTTSRRVWGGRAEADVFQGWTLGLNYRADIASAADAGTCPGTACNTGAGIGVDVEGTLIPGVGLTVADAAYTQTSAVTRAYYRTDIVFDVDQLAGPHSLHPTVTVWYKNFDPYTIPGADGTVPRGGFLTPDDFKLFSVNDNLAAVGSRVDLQLTNDLAAFALGEWGNYKGGGPSYNVSSVGLRYSLPRNVIVKLAYSAYAVAGGSFISPTSLIPLSNALLYQLEFTQSW